MVFTIIYGLICLGIVVFIHEFGHFLAARLCGITVEAFSIGWGPTLLHKKIGDTDYRLALVPLGGYCAMKGENAVQQAIENDLTEIPQNDDTAFYSVSPLKRMLIAFAGPFFNLLFAIIASIIVQGVGYTQYSYENRIVLASELDGGEGAANRAGLLSGDKIVKIGSAEISCYADIQRAIASRPLETVPIVIERNGAPLETALIPELDAETGAGKIGVYPWIEPIVAAVEEGSPAEYAGLREGDYIKAINGVSIRHAMELLRRIEIAKDGCELLIERSGLVQSVRLTAEALSETDGLAGIKWPQTVVPSQKLGPLQTIAAGTKSAFETLALTIKSVSILFKGINVNNAVSGPIRITYMLGTAAEAGFSAGFKTGLVSVLNFLSVVSVSLFFMNLLPVPILDGCTILISVIEAARKKSLRPKTIYYIQIIGTVIIALLIIFIFFNDILYFVK